MARRKWVLRSAIIWHRKSALAEAVLDRPRRSYENIFMFAKTRNYYFNRKALKDVSIEEDVWTIKAKTQEHARDFRLPPFRKNWSSAVSVNHGFSP